VTARKSAAPKTEKVDPDKVIAQEHAAGFFGVEVDPTPNEHYTVAGVLAGKPTPETDAELAAHVATLTNVTPKVTG
jgi:hypothetical protein